MIRRLALVLAAALVALAPAGRADTAKDGFTPLFNGKDLTGWTTYLKPPANATDPKPDPAKTWTIEDGAIHCAGLPMGYLLTDKAYGDYVLRVQWKWGTTAKKGGNSGVFLHVSGPDKIWPKGVEAQLMDGRAGDIWLVDNFKLTIDPARHDKKAVRRYARTTDDIEKPKGEWNQYEITCQGKSIKLAVNGKVVNDGTDAEAASGKILLQSEGAEIWFRNIEIKTGK